MMSHVMNLLDARDIVRNTKFYPTGMRPADGGNADGQFCMMPFAEYIKFANENRLFMIQIKDPEPLEQMNEICALDIIDIIFFGLGDFSQAIGDSGNLNNPEVCRAREKVAAVAKKHGKFARTTATLNNYKQWQEMGCQLVNISADVVAIAHTGRIL